MTRISYVLAMLILSSCSSPAKPESSSTKMAAWQLAEDPLLTLGENEDSLQFSRIAGVVQLESGTIVVANAAFPPQIHLFSQAGDHLKAIGREGRGPGEFNTISWIRRLPGDTIVAYDGWLARLTFLDAAGAVARIVDLPADRFGAMAGAMSIICILDDGSAIAAPTMLFNSTSGGTGRSRKLLTRVTASGTPTQIATVPGTEYAPRPGSSRSMQKFFGLNTIVACAGNRIFAATGERLKVDEYDTRGAVVRSYEAAYRRRRVADADLKAELQRYIDDVPAREQKWVKDEVRELRDRAPVADSFPAVGRYLRLSEWAKSILVDDAGRLWVQQYVGPRDQTAWWSLFARDGRYLGDLESPRNYWIMQVQGQRTLGVFRDSLGVESIRIYDYRPQADSSAATSSDSQTNSRTTKAR